nr:hypothetical protein [Tanacetum cinerariifolium]
GKENRVNILKSIDEGPFRMGTLRETLTEELKDRYNADIRATNILLQGLSKDIYSLINHYTDAKDIWDNGKMLLEGSELTKENRESQLGPTAKEFALLDEDNIYSQSKTHNEHYALWEVIEFGDSYKAPPEETGKVPPSESSTKKKGRTVITIEDMQKRRNDVKVRTTLLLALPEEHQLRFSKYETTQELWEAILKTFETLEQTFNRLQAIVSHLEFMDVEIKQDDLNQKFLTSLAPEWLMYIIVWRNRDDLDTMSLYDVYNYLKVYEPEIIYEDIIQIDEDDIEEIDINWNMALLSMRADRFWKKTGKKITIQGSDVAGFDKSKVECFNCHKMSHFARECRAPRSQDREKRESYKQGPKEEKPAPKALMAIDGIGWDWSYMANEEENHALVADDEVLTEFSLMAKSSSSLENKKDLSWTGLPEFVDDTVTDYSRPTPSIDESKCNTSNNFSVSEHGESSGSIMSKPLIKFVKAADCPRVTKTNNTKNGRKSTVKYAEMYRNTSKNPKVRANQRNISYLSEYEPHDGGYVSFGHGGGKITHKGIIKTGKLEFENVYFMKELKYNMFSVSQIYDNKNSVLFTDSECIVLGKDFKLKDDNNVLLRTPRQHNMYSIDLNNIVPHKNLTCLVAKASIDESMLWHRRLGHLNFKTINKLVRNNLVRGLPSKCFENDYTCVACLKGKQHKAFCKTKTKNETSSILRNFITEIEDLKDLKEKIIKCDNGGEFKNKEVNEFCTKKGIRREFGNARTPQQNRVTERRNRTLIEAAKTMLADAKLPVTFWAEAVNTACYVQNRVLVNKSQNKTPYELFNSRIPAIGFLRPIGCHVMILNSLDHLGKFDAKGDEGYFVGYSMSSKAFRVFNKRTKKVEENLHVDFLENKLIKKGVGLNWLFDIDTLINSMNYVPMVVAGTSSTNISGTKAIASQAIKKDVSSLRYIALPNWFHKAHMETKNSDGCNADDPKSSGISNPTGTSKVPSVEKVKPAISLTVETKIPTVSSPVPIVCLDTSPGSSSDPRIISKGDFSQKETPSLGNALTLSNRFEDTFRDKADLSNMETSIPMDVKSAFLYGTIDEEVYVMQPPGFQDPEFPNRVYKTLFIKKHKGEFLRVQVYVDDIIFGSSNPQLCREFEALMHDKFQMSDMGELTFFFGLQVLQKKDGIFLSQDKYVGDILKKFKYSDVRSMIGSLMYLTASRPNIMFAVYACARHQVTPKECHLHAVKRIFRYLKGHPKLGLWYPKDSSFDLGAYLDSDYGGATQDRKSTTGGCQFLGRRLISWQCKKQTIVATFTTEAEYVAAASGRRQLAFCDYHNMIAILEKIEHNINFHQIVDFLEALHIRYALTISPTVYVSHIRQFWSTPRIETTNLETKILATVDDVPASLLRDDRQGEAFPTVSSLDAGHDSMQQRLQELMEFCTNLQRQQTQLAAKIKDQDLKISGLKARVKFLKDKDKGSAEPTQEDAPIKMRIKEIGKEVRADKSTELGSNDTDEMVNVLSSMEVANILTNGVAATSVSPVAGVSTKEKFIPVWKQLEDFVPMLSKEEGKRVKRQGLKIDQGSSKRMKTSKEDHKGMMQLVPLKEVYVEALQVKHPIIDWEIHSEEKREYWKIIRLGGHTAVYQFFVDMLKQFDIKDLYQQWTLQTIQDEELIEASSLEFALLDEDNIYSQSKTHGRHNRGYGNYARGAGAAGYGGAQNRVGFANPGQARHIKCCNCNGIGHLARNYTQPKQPQKSKYFKDKIQDNAVDEDVDEQPVQDLALNVDNVFLADDCDAFDFDVDEAPTIQTLFMANLSSADHVYDEAGLSYHSDVLSEVHDHDHYQDAVCEHHEVHKMDDDVQPNYVVDSHTDYTSDSNMIPYNQYVKDNAVQVVQSNAFAVPNDAYMMLLNDMHKSPAQHVSVTTQNKEAKVEKPLDRLVASACLYTKHSKELFEYVIGTCPKDFTKRDKKQATTPLNRKKQVTFVDQCETSNANTQKHVEQQITQKTNVLVLPSTGVDSCTDTSRSKPRSNTKKNRISPAKSVNNKTVQDHSKTNKSNLQKSNRVDSSISSKRIVINLNSNSVCQTCNKCFILANHDINKSDRRGIIVKNKARLVAQGQREEKGIDNDEVFAPIARIKAIRLFLAYASFIDFTVYQMDVKNAFLYGTIENKVYVSQPSGFVDPEFPDIVCKVEKALYGLHQAPRAWYETLSNYLLENRFRRGKINKTLFIKKIKDDILLVQVYVDDIIFGSTKRSLSTEFEQLMHNRFQMSTIGELTFFLGLQTKIHVDNESAICVVKNHVYRSKTKHIEIRHNFIRDSYEKRLIEMVKIHTDSNVVDLLTKAFDVTRFQFLVVEPKKVTQALDNESWIEAMQEELL